jgi:hypothetical protein
MPFKILFLGDIVGRPGRRAVAQQVPELRKQHGLQFVVANAENAAAGSGLTPGIVSDLLNAGVDVLTSGDHIFRRRDVMSIIDRETRLLRPVNISPQAAGRGWGVFQAGEVKVGVFNALGRVFLGPAECPFAAATATVEELRNRGAQVILLDFHAEATSEKIAMGWHLAGHVTAVCGTHTHVVTADEQIVSGGTAYITDAGMCGPHDSVIGREKEPVLYHFRTQMPQRFEVARGDVQLNGVLITAEPATGRAVAIERLKLRVND